MKKKSSTYSKILLTAVEIRFKNIFGPQCAAMLACIWIDPRFQVSLNARQKEIAKELLISLYARVSENEGKNANESTTEQTGHTNEGENTLELLMQTFELKSTVLNPPTIAFAEFLETFNAMKTMPLTCDPLEYWKAKQSGYPKMYMLATILFAVPGTQAAIERNFSSLNRSLTYIIYSRECIMHVVF